MSINSHFLDALAGKNLIRPPVWLMRQAGRYLPEYRELKAKHSFLDLCKNSELIVETTLLPFKHFDFDAAILFSDILLPLESLDISFRFDEKKGPLLEKIDLSELPTFDVHRFRHQFAFQNEAIRSLKSELKVPLLGFCGAPFTLAAYLIEGGTSHHFEKTKYVAYNFPDHFLNLLNLLTDLCIASLQLQIAAGVDAVQIFDTHLNILDAEDVKRFSLPFIKRIMDEVTGPTILFAKGPHFETLKETKPTVFSVDWTIDLGSLHENNPSQVFQGNLDPFVLLGPQDLIRKKVAHILESIPCHGHIFNLGHGILPGTPLESVHTLLETVHQCTPIAL